MPDAHRPPDGRLPVTVLSGFLGAGKTSTLAAWGALPDPWPAWHDDFAAVH